MNWKSALAAMILGAAVAAGASSALPALAAQSSQRSTSQTEFGSALPPIGFLRYCANSPTECPDGPRQVVSFKLTPERWQTLYRVNRLVNNVIEPVSDLELYGEVERWALPTTKGDCEDYVLLKKKDLEQLGFPSSSLLITVVLDENKQGHAVLTVATDDGDFILDNRRNDVLRWTDTNYTYLKRQARDNERRWTALVRQPPSAEGAIAATRSKE